MKKFGLHKKQKKFLKEYLKYWFPSFPISDLAHERVLDVVDTGVYYENDQDLLNKIRRQCRSRVMKDGDGLWEQAKPKLHKTASPLKTGYVFTPYIPMYTTPLTYNSSTQKWTPKKGLMKRYAKKVVNKKYYGNIKIDATI